MAESRRLRISSEFSVIAVPPSARNLDEVIFFQDVGGELVAVDAARVQADQIQVAGRVLFENQTAGGVVTEDQQAVVGAIRVVPAGADGAADGRPGADDEEFVAGSASQTGCGVDAGVDQEECLCGDIERELLQPEEEAVGDRAQLVEGELVVRFFDFGLAAVAQIAELAQETVIVVAQDHLGAGFCDDAPDAEGIGAAGEGVAGEQQAVQPWTSPTKIVRIASLSLVPGQFASGN